MVTDQISDLLTRIRNAQIAGHPTVTSPGSKSKERLLKVLLDEGFIAGYEAAKDADGKGTIKIRLKYSVSGAPVIKEVNRISRPGKRVYVSSSDIPSIRSGLGVVLVSTSRGMMSDRVARREGIGGELICSVF